MEIDKKNVRDVKQFLFDYCQATAFVEASTGCESDEAFLLNVANVMVAGGWSKGDKAATIMPIKKNQ